MVNDGDMLKRMQESQNQGPEALGSRNQDQNLESNDLLPG